VGGNTRGGSTPLSRIGSRGASDAPTDSAFQFDFGADDGFDRPGGEGADFAGSQGFDFFNAGVAFLTFGFQFYPFAEFFGFEVGCFFGGDFEVFDRDVAGVLIVTFWGSFTFRKVTGSGEVFIPVSSSSSASAFAVPSSPPRTIKPKSQMSERGLKRRTSIFLGLCGDCPRLLKNYLV
jgi:hypothetical protein